MGVRQHLATDPSGVLDPQAQRILDTFAAREPQPLEILPQQACRRPTLVDAVMKTSPSPDHPRPGDRPAVSQLSQQQARGGAVSLFGHAVPHTDWATPLSHSDPASWSCSPHVRDMVPRMKSSSGFPVDSGLRVAKHGPNARVVTVVGQIDGPTGLELANSLIAQLAVASVVIVDLDGVQLLGSGGLSALFEANELAARQGRALRLVCHSQIAMWALEAAGLWECFTFADSVPDALKNSPRRLDVIDVGVARRRHRRRSRRSLPRDSTVARRATTLRRRRTTAVTNAIHRGGT